MPALLKNTSMGPSACSTDATMALTAASSLTSHATPTAPSSELATASAPSPLRSTTATRAPAVANALEQAAPIPLAPPVTVATFPESCMSGNVLPSSTLMGELEQERAVVDYAER